MLNAKELDAHKFPSTNLRMHDNIYYTNLQQQVKQEVKEIEEDEAKMLFQLTESFLPKREITFQSKVDEKLLNNIEKFSMIMRAVSEQSGIPVDKIKKHRHFKDIVIPRSIVIFLTRYATTLSINQIGRAVMNGVKLHHSTIIHSCIMVKEAMDLRQQDTYELLLKVVAQLNDEGLHINFKYNHPVWYQKLLQKNK